MRERGAGRIFDVDHDDYCRPGWCIFPPGDPRAEQHGRDWQPSYVRRVLQRAAEGYGPRTIASLEDLDVSEVMRILKQ
jgi:hypothetical protein